MDSSLSCLRSFGGIAQRLARYYHPLRGRDAASLLMASVACCSAPFAGNGRTRRYATGEPINGSSPPSVIKPLPASFPNASESRLRSTPKPACAAKLAVVIALPSRPWRANTASNLRSSGPRSAKTRSSMVSSLGAMRSFSFKRTRGFAGPQGDARFRWHALGVKRGECAGPPRWLPGGARLPCGRRRISAGPKGAENGPSLRCSRWIGW
jgi:hypothetical protein